MIYALKERIGKPEFFTGRKKEMDYFLRWIHNIPKEISKSTAILSRRKSGKTAILERLFNILWEENGQIIPLYMEIEEKKKWVHNLSHDYFVTFFAQYVSFKLRNHNILQSQFALEDLVSLVEKNQIPHLAQYANTFLKSYKRKDLDNTFSLATKFPHSIAALTGDFFVVMIDEFQYMNEFIFRNAQLTLPEPDVVGGYHTISESKIAPMLVAGSYVGWLRNIIGEYFIGRMRSRDLNPKLTPEEGLQCVYTYSDVLDVPVTDETAVLINDLTKSDPFFINCVLSSDCENHDLTNPDHVIETMAHELENPGGELQKTWREYIGKTIAKVNDRDGKRIVLFLNQERNREFTRLEIAQKLNLTLTDDGLEKKLKMLVFGDLIGQGVSNFRYSGIQDDLLDKIFRYIYQEELENFHPDFEIEYQQEMERLIQENRSLRGRLNHFLGHIPEYFVARTLKSAHRKKLKLHETVENCPQGLDFSEYESVRDGIRIKGDFSREYEIDVYAKSLTQESLVFEIKNMTSNPVTLEGAKEFYEKLEMAKKIEKNEKMFGVYLSCEGFLEDAKKFLHEKGIMTADFLKWFGGTYGVGE